MMSRPRVDHGTPVYPIIPSEATIQAELYHQARLVDLEVALEVVVWLPEAMAKYPPLLTKLRADLGLLSGEQVVALVEVKRRHLPDGVLVSKGADERQRVAYEATCLPWVFCRGLEDIPQTLAWLANVAEHGRFHSVNGASR